MYGLRMLPGWVCDDVTTVERIDADVTVERCAGTTEHFRPRTEQLLALKQLHSHLSITYIGRIHYTRGDRRADCRSDGRRDDRL